MPVPSTESLPLQPGDWSSLNDWLVTVRPCIPFPRLPLPSGSHIGYNGVIGVSSAFPLGNLMFFPMILPGTVSFSAMLGEVTSVGPAGSGMRFGLYQDAGGFPSVLLGDAGAFDGSSTGVKSQPLAVTAANVVWVASVMQSSQCSIRYWSGGLPYILPWLPPPSPGPTLGQGLQAYVLGGVNGALPTTINPASLGNYAAGIPAILLKVA